MTILCETQLNFYCDNYGLNLFLSECSKKTYTDMNVIIGRVTNVVQTMRIKEFFFFLLKLFFLIT